MMQAQAAVLRGATDPFTVEQVILEGPRSGELLIQVVGCGLCHTDLLARSMPAGHYALPMIFGHEASGIVVETGPGVSAFAAGDRVIVSFDSCSRCIMCRRGEPAYCENFNLLNVTGRRPDGSAGAVDADGFDVGARWFGQSSLAQYAVASERACVSAPADAPLELLGPLGCGVQTGAASVLETMRIRPGESLAVFGAGTVGLSAVMAARLAGVADIVVVDVLESRRSLALELGATHVFDRGDPEVVDQLRVATGGGTCYTLETTGHPQVIRAAVAALRPRGFCGLVGVSTKPARLAPDALGAGRTISYLMEGGAVPRNFIPRLIRLWQDSKFPFDQLITPYPLHAINQAESDCTAGKCVKALLLPG
jgi:aryl-alcohol dehydrogenase